MQPVIVRETYPRGRIVAQPKLHLYATYDGNKAYAVIRRSPPPFPNPGLAVRFVVDTSIVADVLRADFEPCPLRGKPAAFGPLKTEQTLQAIGLLQAQVIRCHLCGTLRGLADSEPISIGDYTLYDHPDHGEVFRAPQPYVELAGDIGLALLPGSRDQYCMTHDERLGEVVIVRHRFNATTVDIGQQAGSPGVASYLAQF